jgi:flagellar motor switch protein FliG
MAATLTISNMDKAAIVLCSLSPYASETVLGMLNPDRTPRLRELMDIYRGSSELEELREAVLQEFSSLKSDVEGSQREYGFVGQGRDKKRALETALQESESDPEKNAEAEAERKKQLGDFDSGDDPTDSLKAIEIGTLVRALQSEHPRAVAIAMHRMGPEKASEVIKRLDPEVRSQTFVLMAEGLPENVGLVHRVVQAIVEMCAQRDEEEVSDENESYFSQLAEILHLIDREDRGAMLKTLQETNAEAYKEVDACLYDYTDVMKIEERSLQKILAEIDLKVMATAMSGAPAEVESTIMGNMSERVRTMLQEEMEFLGGVSSKKIDDARREIADVIRKHDKAETLVWKSKD